MNQANTETPLLCLPFAGAGASFYRAWRRLAVEGVDVQPLQLPGREERLAEEPCTDVREAVAGLLPLVLRRACESPVALFGHSLGAALAYELACRLLEHGDDLLLALFVSGSPAPWDGREERAEGLADDELLNCVEELAGYRHPAFDVPEMRDLLLPALRADVLMHERYAPAAPAPLPIAITAFRGTDDRLVTAAASQRWKEATSASFEAVELPGGHMYLTDEAVAVLKSISTRLAPAPGKVAHAVAR